MAQSTNDPSHNMVRFLKKNLILKGSTFTHTSLGKPHGSYFIPSENTNDFYRLYSECIDAHEELYMTEKHRHVGPLIIDLDFRFNITDAPKKDKHLYSQENLHKIVEEYAIIVQDIFDLTDLKQAQFDIYVLEKDCYSIHEKDPSIIKDGIHIIFPSIVSRASIQYMIRNNAMEKLGPTFKEMNCINDANDIIDEAIIERNNWLMYGSKKQNGLAYKISHVFNVDTATDTITYSSKKDNDLELPDTLTLVKLLSIRNKFDETLIKTEIQEKAKKLEDEIEQRRRRMETARNIIGEKNNTSKVQHENIEQIIKLVNILSLNRIDNYNDWIRLGWCLRNIDYRLLNAWDAFSKKSKKYVEGQCESMWDKMKVGGLGVGTLHMWAKSDNAEQYRDIVREDLRELIFQSRSGTHNDVAHVIFHMYRYDYVCTSIKLRNWYEFNNHRWHSCDGGYSLRMKISNEVWREFLAASRDWTQKAMDTGAQQDQTLCQEHAKRMAEISLKLKSTTFKDNLMKECSELFYNQTFETTLDSNLNLICFENGVYDLDTLEFREGRPEDYVSLTTSINYIPNNPSNPILQEINSYFAQVLTKSHIREYVLKLFSTFLHGAIKEQKFYIWTGSGSNSKSLCVEFFEKCFGEYCCKFPITLLTQKRVASNAATSELARAKGKRFACLQEPSEDEKLNIGLMKELSGGDKILARAIYKEPVEFKPQFKMLLLCNHLPSVPSDDGGTWRRIRVVEFLSKFVDNPIEESEFPIDLELSIRMEEWKEAFMSMLIEYFKLYKQEGLHEPEEILACTREYKRQNDHLADFIHNCVDKKEGAFLSLNDAFLELKAWVKDDNINLKMPTKSELDKYLSQNLTKCVCNNNFKGYKGFRLKNRYQLIDTEDYPE